MGYDRGDSFPFDFEPNRIPICSKSKGKLSFLTKRNSVWFVLKIKNCQYDHIPFNLKGIGNLLL